MIRSFRIYPQSLSAFEQKITGIPSNADSSASRSFPQSVGVAPKKKSGRKLSCGHGNSTGNRKSLTIRVQVGILRTLRQTRHKRYAQISITRQLYHKILWLSRKQRLTATWKSILSGDIHTPEAAQNTAVTDAGSPHAPTGLLFYGLFGFCQQEHIQRSVLQHESAQFLCCDDTPRSIHIAISTSSRCDND